MLLRNLHILYKMCCLLNKSNIHLSSPNILSLPLVFNKIHFPIISYSLDTHIFHARQPLLGNPNIVGTCCTQLCTAHNPEQNNDCISRPCSASGKQQHTRISPLPTRRYSQCTPRTYHWNPRNTFRIRELGSSCRFHPSPFSSLRDTGIHLLRY